MTPYEAAYAIGEAKENFCDNTNETNYPMDFYAHDSLGMIFIVNTGILQLFQALTFEFQILFHTLSFCVGPWTPNHIPKESDSKCCQKSEKKSKEVESCSGSCNTSSQS